MTYHRGVVPRTYQQSINQQPNAATPMLILLVSCLLYFFVWEAEARTSRISMNIYSLEDRLEDMVHFQKPLLLDAARLLVVVTGSCLSVQYLSL